VEPRRWFVTEHVREKFSCRSCEKIAQPPAPFHAIARGYAGPSLLAMILVAKYADHQPLNRQSEQFDREGIEIPLATMADHVGACSAALLPLYELIKAREVLGTHRHEDVAGDVIEPREDHVMLHIYLDGDGTHAAAAHPTVLPIRILQLCPAAHVRLSLDDAASRKIRLAVASVWSLSVESESVCK
jgi:hypothetical protein